MQLLVCNSGANFLQLLGKLIMPLLHRIHQQTLSWLLLNPAGISLTRSVWCSHTCIDCGMPVWRWGSPVDSVTLKYCCSVQMSCGATSQCLSKVPSRCCLLTCRALVTAKPRKGKPRSTVLLMVSSSLQLCSHVTLQHGVSYVTLCTKDSPGDIALESRQNRLQLSTDQVIS